MPAAVSITGDGSAGGIGTALGVGYASGVASGNGVVGGMGMAVGVGIAAVPGSVGTAGGIGTALGDGGSLFTSGGSAGGMGMACGVGQSLSQGVGAALGIGGAGGGYYPHTIHYHIYASDMGGSGGPIIYTAPIGDTTSLTFTTPALPFPGTYQFLVRPWDYATGYEDQNGDARLTVVLDVLGNDITKLPNAPYGLTIQQRANGSGLLRFAYNPGGQGGAPTRFDAYIGVGSVNYAVSVGNCAYQRGRGMGITLSGLTAGSTYLAGVRARNATGQEQNTTTITFTVPASPPSAVLSLTAIASP